MARRALLTRDSATAVVAAALVPFAFAGCFFDPQLGSGQIACSTSGACPSGQTCGGDDRCHVPGAPVMLHPHSRESSTLTRHTSAPVF